MLGTSGISTGGRGTVALQVSGPGYFGTRNVADEIVDARELTDVGHPEASWRVVRRPKG